LGVKASFPLSSIPILHCLACLIEITKKQFSNNEEKRRRNPMIPIVDISNYVKSEYIIKRDEMRRSRRWIIDASRMSDEQWQQVSAIQSVQPSILDRISNLMKFRRSPVGSKS
jgi:hypothetical protein